MRHRVTTCRCSDCNRFRSWLDAAASSAGKPQADGKTRDDSGETKPRPKAMPPPSLSALLPPRPPPPPAQWPFKRRRLDLEGGETPGEEATTISYPPNETNPLNANLQPYRPIPGLQEPPTRTSRSDASSQQQPLPLRLSDSLLAVPGGRPKLPSPSTIERIDQLQNLRPPIKYAPINDPKAQLPRDVQALFATIRKMATYRSGFIPSAARDLAMRKDPEAGEWPSIYFFKTESQDSQLWTPDSESDVEAETGEKYIPTAVGRANKEFMTLRRIQRRAAEALRMGHSESAWNTFVHAPLFDLAVRSRRGVALEQITTAAIVPEWLPDRADNGFDFGDTTSSLLPEVSDITTTPWFPEVIDMGESAATTSAAAAAGGKTMADFAFVLALDDPPKNQRPDYDALKQRVEEVVTTQPDGLETISQSVYGPLTRRPVGVVMATKGFDDDLNKGRIQLAVGAAAWHERMRALCGICRPRFVTLPLLLGGERKWDLYFACDRGDDVGIEIVGPVDVGGTGDLPSLYVFLAVLRALAAWVDGPFKMWMMELLGVEEETKEETK